MKESTSPRLFPNSNCCISVVEIENTRARNGFPVPSNADGPSPFSADFSIPSEVTCSNGRLMLSGEACSDVGLENFVPGGNEVIGGVLGADVLFGNTDDALLFIFVFQ